MVCIDEPSNGAYYGGVVAKPVGQEFFSNLFKAKNILPDVIEDCSLKPSVEMPNVVGESTANALAKLKSLNLNVNVDGEGAYIINQLPTAGIYLYPGDEVLVITN